MMNEKLSIVFYIFSLHIVILHAKKLKVETKQQNPDAMLIRNQQQNKKIRNQNCVSSVQGVYLSTTRDSGKDFSLPTTHRTSSLENVWMYSTDVQCKHTVWMYSIDVQDGEGPVLPRSHSYFPMNVSYLMHVSKQIHSEAIRIFKR